MVDRLSIDLDQDLVKTVSDHTPQRKTKLPLPVAVFASGIILSAMIFGASGNVAKWVSTQ